MTMRNAGKCAHRIVGKEKTCIRCRKKLNVFERLFAEKVPVSKPRYDRYADMKDYLSWRGMLHLAKEPFNVTIQTEQGELICVRLKGYEGSSDALDALKKRGVLPRDGHWKFENWPNIERSYAPWANHVSACVCELNPNVVYRVISFDPTKIALLYGCPNPSSIDYGHRINMVRIEVVDYGKR